MSEVVGGFSQKAERALNSTLIGLVDTGIDREHPELASRIVGVHRVREDGMGWCADTTPTVTLHGTANARLIARSAPEARLVCVDAIEEGQARARLLLALDAMVDLRPRVLCLPLGFRGNIPFLFAAISALERTGVLTIAAIGNNGGGQSVYPASDPRVLAAGAASSGRVDGLSGSVLYQDGNGCQKPELVLRECSIDIELGHGRRTIVKGTSHAAATLAGLAANLLAEVPWSHATAVTNALCETATPPSVDQSHRCRYGLPQQQAALNYLRANPNVEASVSSVTCPNYGVDPALRRRVEAEPGVRLSIVAQFIDFSARARFIINVKSAAQPNSAPFYLTRHSPYAIISGNGEQLLELLLTTSGLLGAISADYRSYEYF